MITDTTNVWQQDFSFCCTLLGFCPGNVSLLSFFVRFPLLKHVYTAADMAMTGCVYDVHRLGL